MFKNICVKGFWGLVIAIIKFLEILNFISKPIKICMYKLDSFLEFIMTKLSKKIEESENTFFNIITLIIFLLFLFIEILFMLILEIFECLEKNLIWCVEFLQKRENNHFHSSQKQVIRHYVITNENIQNQNSPIASTTVPTLANSIPVNFTTDTKISSSNINNNSNQRIKPITILHDGRIPKNLC